MYFIIFLVLFIGIRSDDDMEKYHSLREQCQRHPSNVECVQLKSKFLQLIEKCQKINTKEQFAVCQQIKVKLCAVFPSYCLQTTTTKTTRKQTKPKLKPTITTTTTTVKPMLISNRTMSNEEFVQVPVNPEELRVRGEYCIRHGKEKKCQELLNNLKTTYSSCNKKKPDKIDCHSFQTHLCKAFPKFPPCIKKSP